MTDDPNERSIYALLIGAVIGFASGVYLFSSKDSTIRNKIEEEIAHLYKSNVELDTKQIKEIEKIKKSLITLLDDLNLRIKNSLRDGKKD
jgi:gas vesicle protein